MTGVSGLTPAVARALIALSTKPHMTPAELGYAASAAVGGGQLRSMKPQGAGRFGGGLGTALVKLELAKNHETYSRRRGRIVFHTHGYEITAAGQSFLRQLQKKD